MEAFSDYAFTGEPLSNWDLESLDRLLAWSVEHGLSDITLRPRSPIRGRWHGNWYQLVRRSLSMTEVDSLADQLTRDASASAKARSASPSDFAYEVEIGRGRHVRFRGNLSGCMAGWGTGSEIILRMIPESPPSPAAVGLDADLLSRLEPESGMVLFAGTTGSGKTTSLAAILKNILRVRRVNMQTIEDPIEFSLREKGDDLGYCAQHEIPHHYTSFGIALRNMVRKAPDVILVGEMRDRETMQNGLHLANAGAVVYTTLHADSVPQALMQIVNRFDYPERPGVWSQLVPACRMIVYQKLVQKEGGGRVCLREHLEITPEVRRKLQLTDVGEITKVTQRLLDTMGHPLVEDARKKLEAADISQDVYKRATQERMLLVENQA